MSRFTAIIVCLLMFTSQAAAQASAFLDQIVKDDVDRFPARVGLYVKHLDTGKEIAVRAEEKFNSASVIKIAILAMAFKWVDEGKLDLDERVEISPSDFRGGSGIFRLQDPGLKPTIRDVLTQMIATSDNSATDMMIGRLGGVDAVNDWIQLAGYKNTRLVQTTFAIFRSIYEPLGPEYKLLNPQELYAIQTNHPYFVKSHLGLIQKFRADSDGRMLREEWRENYRGNPSGWLGVMNPRETGRILEDIQLGRLGSDKSTKEMLRMLRSQKSGASRLPHYVNVPVAHKTGDLSDVANDVGIIYAHNGPIVMAVFTSEITGNYGELEDLIGRLAQRIVGYFDGK